MILLIFYSRTLFNLWKKWRWSFDKNGLKIDSTQKKKCTVRDFMIGINRTFFLRALWLGIFFGAVNLEALFIFTISFKHEK